MAYKVSVVSLGCPKNLVDTENLLEGLGREGFDFTTDPDDADIVLVNTCGFIEDAKRESIEEILRLRHIKDEGGRLLVFGCLANRHGKDLLQEIPEIDALWGVGEEAAIIEYCKAVMERGNGETEKRGHEEECVKLRNWKAEKRRNKKNISRSVESYAYLKIAEGCNRGCTYCVIPSIRGPYKSIEPDAILRKAEEKIGSGIKELVLVAQDIASYGREYRGYNLPSLLRDISSISGDFRIRLLYLYPTVIDDELLSAVSDEDNICKYLDIPLQHSENGILKAMGRSGTKEGYKRTIKRIREAIPEVTLRTTFIVGFPGEREEDFIGLKGFIEDMRFERLGVFAYSKEDGTPAAKIKGSIPKRIKERRREEIMRIQSQISLEKNKALIGKSFGALVDEVDGSVAIGRLRSQAPEIDGVVFIENAHGAESIARHAVNTPSFPPLKVTPPGYAVPPLKIRGGKGGVMISKGGRGSYEHKNIPKSKIIRPGQFVNVLIKEAYDYDLRGELVD